MATRPRIFDRQDVVDAIESICLGESGASGVLLSSQKVGKSYLLDHIFSGSPQGQTNVFCRLNLDFLSGWKEDGESLSDKIFLSFFLDRLRERLKDREAKQSAEEEGWNKGNEETVSRLKENLRTLRKCIKTIEELLEQPTIKTRKVASLLEDLKGIGKRVVLFIDNYHQMLVEPGFSDDLFRFLRGVNTDGTMIVLASSTVRLMDRSLHPESNERPSLVNHFKPQTLEPFGEKLADNFLDWLSLGRTPLTSEEKAYLRELGGGSPYFLKIAHEEFVLRKNPGPPERQEFERGHLAPSFEAGFRDIWQRLTPEKRAVLHEVAAGEAIATGGETAMSLQIEGYLILTGAKAKMFSRLFADFVARQTEEEPMPELAARASLSYKFLPTALCFATPGATEPLISFILTNPRTQKAKVRVTCWLEEYSQRVSKVETVPPHKRLTVPLPVVLKKRNIRDLKDPDNTLAKWVVEELKGPNWTPMEEGFWDVYVLAIDQFIFARRDEVRQKVMDCTWLIAAWVQDNEPGLQEIKKAARDAVPGGLSGYPPMGPGSPDQVRAQVKALYDALKKRGLAYDTSAATYDQDVTNLKQRVRLPGRILNEGGANCLEGCVLFASLLSASELHPIVLFLPGHAIVGWKVSKGDDAKCEFIETTGIKDDAFEKAHEKGCKKYEEFEELCTEWQRNAPEDPLKPREIRDPRRIVIPVDIHKVRQLRSMLTLPHEPSD